jgi:hypothetical protein
MRAPGLEIDGWRLLDGEDFHRRFPTTFEIPDLALRKILRPGDFAKLIFEMIVADDEHAAVERMWVIVRELTPSGYVGMLDNEPSLIGQNDRLWVGSEMPFDYRHIIAVRPRDKGSAALAKAPVPIPWVRPD